MILLNPAKFKEIYPDPRMNEIMQKTIQWFENRGKKKLKEDDLKHSWYSEFLEFIGQEKIFAHLLTPQPYAEGDENCRWDTSRICAFNELMGFYGLCYWYTWQVSILGLGPIWMTKNEDAKLRASRLLKEGAIFAFGLSERQHGADVYSTDMALEPLEDGTYRANGEKYYIGNGNEAEMVSTFGKMTDTGEYVFFAANYRKPEYDCIRNVCASQNFVAQYALHDYPVEEKDILHKGQDAWNAALNTVNIGKYNLGWASIGMSTHSLYEAIRHASNRKLYGMHVTDFPHVKRFFVDAYSRLVAMKLFALRAADYMRTASLKDRRYLLYNPIVKMKVTTQGEEVMNLLWDVIAAKGFEKDTFFEMAARDIRALPKLEGTVHVNIALIVKFMANYFFNPDESLPKIDQQMQPGNDDFLFEQGPSRGLGKIQFHDYKPILAEFDLPNVQVFAEQIETFKEMLAMATPDEKQRKDIDFLMCLGEIFTLVVYGQLVLENAKIYKIDNDHIDQIFDFMVRDVSKFALELRNKPSASEKQMDYCLKMLKKPVFDSERYERVWTNNIHPLKDAYEMNE